MRVFALVIGGAMLALLVGGSGCDRNLEPFDPNEKVQPPDLERIFPAEAQPGPGLRASVPAPSAGPTMASASAADGAAPISGSITLAPELEGQVPEGGILFIIARRGTGGGPPLAVRRIPSPQFPLQFTIGPENVMIPSMKFEGEIRLSARLDGDGNAMTRNPGDLQGGLAESVAPGSEVVIVLEERL